MDFTDFGVICGAATRMDWTSLPGCVKFKELVKTVNIAVKSKTAFFRLSVEQKARGIAYPEVDTRVTDIDERLNYLKRILEITNIFTNDFTYEQQMMVNNLVRERVSLLNMGHDRPCCASADFLFFIKSKCNFILFENDDALPVPPEWALPPTPYNRKTDTLTEKILIAIKAKVLLIYLNIEREARLKLHINRSATKLTNAIPKLIKILNYTEIFTSDISNSLQYNVIEEAIRLRVAWLNVCTDNCHSKFDSLLDNISELDNMVMRICYPNNWPALPMLPHAQVVRLARKTRDRYINFTIEYKVLTRLNAYDDAFVDGVQAAIETVKRVLMELDQPIEFQDFEQLMIAEEVNNRIGLMALSEGQTE